MLQTRIQTLCTDAGQVFNWMQLHFGYEIIYAAAVQMLICTSAMYLLLKDYLNKSGYASAVFSMLFNITREGFPSVLWDSLLRETGNLTVINALWLKCRSPFCLCFPTVITLIIIIKIDELCTFSSFPCWAEKNQKSILIRLYGRLI